MTEQEVAMGSIDDVRSQEEAQSQEHVSEGHPVGEAIEAQADGTEVELADDAAWDEAVEKLTEIEGVDAVMWGETDDGDALLEIVLADEAGTVQIVAVPNVVQEDGVSADIISADITADLAMRVLPEPTVTPDEE